MCNATCSLNIPSTLNEFTRGHFVHLKGLILGWTSSLCVFLQRISLPQKDERRSRISIDTETRNTPISVTLAAERTSEQRNALDRREEGSYNAHITHTCELCFRVFFAPPWMRTLIHTPRTCTPTLWSVYILNRHPPRGQGITREGWYVDRTKNTACFHESHTQYTQTCT